MNITPVVTHHFVKSEDLNHHGTLFAGRSAEWFVEAGLLAAASYLPIGNIVCAKIHGMNFSMPVNLGDVAQFIGKAVHTGKTSLIANICLRVREQEVLNGFITFVHVDGEGRPFPHGVEIVAESEEDKALQKQARSLHRD